MQIQCLHLKYTFVIRKYQHIIELYRRVSENNWHDCCKEAVEPVKSINDSLYPVCHESIERWNIEFRKNKFFTRHGHLSKIVSCHLLFATTHQLWRTSIIYGTKT